METHKISLILVTLNIVGIYCTPHPKSFYRNSLLNVPKFEKGTMLQSNPNPKSTNISIFDEQLSECGPYKVDIRELTIEKAQEFFSTGILSSVELTKCYLERISLMDVQLKSVIQLNPDALKIAQNADTERFQHMKISQNPMHGIPILIKDNIGTADKMQTTVGAIALEGLIPKQDSDIVINLREAGAIILGKTNPSEWAYFRDNDIPSGWSGRGNQTKSAYNMTSNPSGSSTGSAVATSANFALVSLGSETDGSILSPSSLASLVGLKPTWGAVSTNGVVPLGFSQDVVGPMTRTVADAEIVLRTISDAKFNCDRYPRRTSRVKAHCHNVDRPITIGVLRDPYWNETDPSLKDVLPKLKNMLENLSQQLPHVMKIIDPVIGNNKEANKTIIEKNEGIVLRHEFKHYLNKYLQHKVHHEEVLLGRSIKSLADIIRFNIGHPSPEGYNQTLLIETEATNGLRNATYIHARRSNRRATQKYLDNILDSYELDALATPCVANETEVLLSFGAIAGYPSITIPAGIDQQNMPFGLCLLGRAYSDLLLLKIGAIFESKKCDGGREPPKFLN